MYIMQYLVFVQRKPDKLRVFQYKEPIFIGCDPKFTFLCTKQTFDVIGACAWQHRKGFLFHIHPEQAGFRANPKEVGTILQHITNACDLACEGS